MHCVKHMHFVNSTPPEIIAEGRQATEYFKRQYGVDFTDVSDDIFFTGNVTRYNGSVSFSSFTISPRLAFYLVSATSPTSAVRYNNYVSTLTLIVPCLCSILFCRVITISLLRHLPQTNMSIRQNCWKW